jgi:hypothetical protein
VQAIGNLYGHFCSVLLAHTIGKLGIEIPAEFMSGMTALMVALQAAEAAAPPTALPQHIVLNALQGARRLADALLAWQQRPEQLEAERLQLAKAQALRSCAYLCCPNVGGGGSMMAGRGGGGKLCSGCRVAWYCGTACSHADWRAGGHKHACAALRAARLREQQQA